MQPGVWFTLFDNQLMSLFSWDIFRQMAANQAISLCKFNLVTNMLVERNIPFDVSFSSGTRKAAAALQLTVHINPSSTLVYVVQLEPGASAFTPSP
jgi:hypothetical protein